MASLRKSLALSAAQQYSALVIHSAAVIVLARLLTPAEIGIFSVGYAVASLAQVLRDFGVGNYLVQEKELTTDRIRTAFGVTLVMGWGLAAVLFALSGPLAGFYGEPGLRPLLQVLSVSFLIIPFGTPALSLLRRDMAFGALYWIGVASALVHATTAVGLAALGFGFMSLAWASLAGAAATAAAAAIARPGTARMMPGFREWRRVVSFGGYTSAASAFSHIGVVAPDLIFGRLLGFTAVGLFSRAVGLIQMFNRLVMNGVMPVLTPAFAAKNRAGEELRGPYLKGLSYVTALAWPFFAFLGLMAYPIIRILFGDQWDAAVPIVQILCLVGIFRPLLYFVQPLFIALGEVKTNLKVVAISNALAVLLLFLGALHSLAAAALAPSIFCCFYFFLSHVYVRDLIGLTFWEIAGAVRKSVAVAVFSALAPVIVFFVMDIGAGNPWAPFLVAGFGTAILWLGSILVFRHPLREEVVLVLGALRVKLKTGCPRV